MKNAIVFGLFLVGLFYGSASGQTNKYWSHQENWTTVAVGANGPQPHTIIVDRYYVSGDSLINGKLFMKVFYKERIASENNGFVFSPVTGDTISPLVLVREENDTITAIMPGSSDTAIFSYNFSSGTIYYDHSQSSPQLYFISYIEDSIVVGGVKRRFMLTSQGKTLEGAFRLWGGQFSPITGINQLDGWNELLCYGGMDSVYADYDQNTEVAWAFASSVSPPVVGECSLENVYYSSVEELLENKTTVYPNPSTGTLHITTPFHFLQYSIRATDGKIVAQGNVGEDFQISTEDLPPGLYFIRLNSGSDVVTRKIIRQ